MTTTSAQDTGTNDPKEIYGWKMADLAWSTFDTTVTTAILGPYFIELIDANGGSINVAGLTIGKISFFPYVLSLASVLKVLILPMFGALADYTPYRKQAIVLPAFLASAATLGLYFVTADTILLGGFLYIVAVVSLAASIVVYNSYLPLITTQETRDRVSSAGHAWGYLAGFTYLAINLLLFKVFDDNLSLAARLSLGGAGLWCGFFLWIGPQRHLKPRPAVASKPTEKSWIGFGFSTLVPLFSELKNDYPQALRYLLTYLIFIDAITAVIALATTFADQELGMESSTLLLVILMIQFMAAPGAIAFGRLAERIGTKQALSINLSIWTVLVLAAVLFLNSQAGFWVLAFGISLVLGGSRAQSRTLFSLMIPPESEGRYFGLYQISAHGSSWAAPLIFGIIAQTTGSARLAIIPVAAFLAIAVVLLRTVDVEQGISDATKTKTTV